MKLHVPYLKDGLELNISDDVPVVIAEPNEYHIEKSSEELIENALSAPLYPKKQGVKTLSEFLQGASSILIIINDATRPTPTHTMLQTLLPRIESAGISKRDITIIIATGAHRGPTEDEYHQILGPLYDTLRPCCVYHNARNEEELQYLGDTRNGTPIYLNKWLFKVDRIIATGSVEPHYFAGFTGGRKAFLPGIAGYKTIEANHKLALSLNAKSLELEDNPVHQDMMDALEHISVPVFSLMTVLNKDQQVAAATAGHIITSFVKAVEIARQIFCVPVGSRADIVISVARFPMDIDLYQSQKAIDNGSVALKDGGTLILVSSCRDGIGDEAYARLLSEADSSQDAIERIYKSYKLGYHKAAKIAQVAIRSNIWAITELPDERLRSMFIEPVHSLQGAFDKAFERACRQGLQSPKVIILPDGCVTVPEISK